MMITERHNILIADSGSTKTDWRFIDEAQNSYHIKTIGFNPYFQDTATIVNEINEHLIPGLIKLHLPGLHFKDLKIFFYGAGCSCEEKCAIVESALHQTFPDAKIEVEHDLLAAARALCGKEEGIAAILGTGSNSCYYNGEKIIENVASLGFILGDEGSGAHMGKLFMQDYLNNDVPKSIADNFYQSYRLNRDVILDAIYKKTMPSKFLASFSKFINANCKEQYVMDLIDLSFNQFFSRHICKYSNHKEVSMNCVGSIAYYYSDTLRIIAGQRGITIDKIIESPIDSLTKYHLNQA